MTKIERDELRKLALAAKQSAQWESGLRNLHTALSPDVTLALLDQSDALEAVVRELVACEALREIVDEFLDPRRTFDLRDDYIRRKPLAWEAARATLGDKP